MAYKVIILYRLYMPSYVLGTFTEYPYLMYLLLFAELFVEFYYSFYSFTENVEREVLIG